MKRLFDLLFSVTVLLFFLPFGIILGLLIASTSSGGVFYRQERIGLNGKAFKLFKFRSMSVNAEKSGSLTVGMRDSRITKVGYLIRKFKIDEFPQFLNVILGDMSIVGPRPEVREFVELYTPEQVKVLHVKPGITDYASIEYFNENQILAQSSHPKKTYIDEVMPNKILLNQKYLKNPGLAQDLKIIWMTIKRLIKLKNEK